MTQYVHYLISDIHLERKNEYKKAFLLESINKVIEKNKNDDKETIIIFSGDVDNGTKGYEWFNKINAQIIYVAGNHEFWANDYYETVENLQKQAPKHVHFLHNDFIECGEHIFVGATMWTDVGKSLNEDLKYVSNGIMNDNYNITAQKWYTEKNKENLKSISPRWGFEDKIEKQGWNILVEQEENEKSIQFFKDFAKIRNQLLRFRKEVSTASQQLTQKYSPMSQEKYDALMHASKLTNYTYKQWLFLCKEHNLIGYEEVSQSMIDNVTSEEEKIYKKLVKINYYKELIVVSHHLPFLEERLIGYYSHIEKSKKLYNEKADSPIYTIRNGLNDYPHHNYFYRIGKGDFGRDESILEAVHYSNNGAVNLPEYFLKDVKTWCHGHDHTLNYQDFVKSIPIITNPMSYSLDVFIFSEKGIHLNDGYKRYHKIDSDEKELAEVEKLRTLVLKDIHFNSHKNEDKNEMIKLWVLSLMDFDKVSKLIENFSQSNKKAFTYLAKNPQFSIGEMTDKQYQKIQEFIFANYYYHKELLKELDKLDMAYAARKDIEFSYMNKVNKLYSKEISNYFLEDSQYNISVENYTQEMMEDYGYSLLTSQLFKNIYFMNKAVKKIKHLAPILKKYEEIEAITELFNQEIPDLYPKEPKNNYLFDRDLEEKKNKILDKYMTEEVTKEKERRYKERFNF